MPRYHIEWWAMVPVGATRERTVKEYYLNAHSERAARDNARDIMKNANVEPIGEPFSIRKVPDA